MFIILCEERGFEMFLKAFLLCGVLQITPNTNAEGNKWSNSNTLISCFYLLFLVFTALLQLPLLSFSKCVLSVYLSVSILINQYTCSQTYSRFLHATSTRCGRVELELLDLFISHLDDLDDWDPSQTYLFHEHSNWQCCFRHFTYLFPIRLNFGSVWEGFWFCSLRPSSAIINEWVRFMNL